MEVRVGNRVAKDALFDAFADLAKAMGNGRRAELVDVLAQGERYVEELASEIDQSVANTSHHLLVLAAAGLVSTRRERTRIYYRLASADVERLWSVIRSVAQDHIDNIDELAADYLGDRNKLDEIGRDELAQRLDAGDLILIDVRPEAEFAAGHISGARSIPIAGFEAAVRDLPTGVEIVAYCRGPYCVFADDGADAVSRAAYRTAIPSGAGPVFRSAPARVPNGARGPSESSSSTPTRAYERLPRRVWVPCRRR